MRKRSEVEEHIKQVIRDTIAVNPIVSVRKVQSALFDAGLRTYQAKPLDWYYVAKLVRKIHNENIATLKFEDKSARLIILREKYRVVSEKLLKVIMYDFKNPAADVPRPTYQEQIAAINMLMRWELAIFYAEVEAGVFNRSPEGVNDPRNKPLDPETRARIIGAMERWGMIKKTDDLEVKSIVKT